MRHRKACINAVRMARFDVLFRGKSGNPDSFRSACKPPFRERAGKHFLKAFGEPFSGLSTQFLSDFCETVPRVARPSAFSPFAVKVRMIDRFTPGAQLWQ